MSRICSICGKKPRAGRSIQRRGLAKKKGGVGQKITGITKRFFLPNLQKVRIKVKGKVKRVYVCNKCLKAGKVNKV
jgi:large subunit ribosomal protein L28